MVHPGLLAALRRNGHSDKILITDGNYPVVSDAPAAAERIPPNLAPGLLDAARVLGVLKRTIPTERAELMVPAADAVGIEAPEVILAHDEYRAVSPSVIFDEIPRWDFYDATKAKGVTVVIVPADQRLCANLSLITGMRAPGE